MMTIIFFQTIAKFDARDKPVIKQISYIVESLSTMYSTDGKFGQADIRSDLMSPIMAYVEKVLIKDVENIVVAALNFPSQQLLYLQRLVEEFCDATLKSVADNFGNFGLMTWCPLLAKICLEVGILKFENIHFEFQRSGESKLLKKSLEFYENSFIVFNQVTQCYKLITMSSCRKKTQTYINVVSKCIFSWPAIKFYLLYRKVILKSLYIISI